jgi:hypothetical protein
MSFKTWTTTQIYNLRNLGIHDWIMVLATVVIAIATGRYTHYASKQLDAINGQLDIMAVTTLQNAKMVTQAVVQADAARRSANAAIRAAQATRDSVVESQKSRISSETQSKAALDSSIQAFRNDQRAWVNIVDFKITNEPDMGKPTDFEFSTYNSGKTPATEIMAKVISGFTERQPPSPDWKDAVFATVHKFMLFPNTGSKDVPSTIPAANITPDIASAYTSLRTRLYAIVRIEYDDAFGCRHWTQVCDMHKMGSALNSFEQCAEYNTIDPLTEDCQSKGGMHRRHP